jgi:peptidoglycan hydrolase-like protein with peptidoglycan-binding domain
MWTMNGAKFALAFGSTHLEIDAENGARITALRVGGSTGQNLLADSASTGELDNWGSTFWPSPQNWSWPPTESGSIDAINSLPYAAVSEGTSLTLTSGVNAAAPTVSVIKKFSADLANEAIVIEYTITNRGSEPVTVAPWEVTRMAAGGLTFYAGNGAPLAHGLPLLPTTDAAGVTWSRHDPTDSTQYKLFADGQGWLAHAAHDLLLIKSFPDLSPEQSPAGEAEIEIYAAQKYVEVEQQGAVQTLAAGEALHWTVRWYARKLSAPAAVGSADLVRYILNQIK